MSPLVVRYRLLFDMKTLRISFSDIYSYTSINIACLWHSMYRNVSFVSSHVMDIP